jgi:ferredoxin/flavodoxin
MGVNIVFYFSGTGNSLKAAKAILKSLGGGDLVCMATERYEFPREYDTIGFVYPVYFWGVPNAVRRFVTGLNFGAQRDSYVYAVATFGGKEGGGITILNKLLAQKGARLSYGQGLRMFSNYVIMYEMSDKVDEITERSDEGLARIVSEIRSRENNKVGGVNPAHALVNGIFAKQAPRSGRHYSISSDCTSCGICADVCPVGNVILDGGAPRFGGRCEQCLACIQFCPVRAINYKNVTAGRRRYTNPDIDCKELASRNHFAGDAYDI